jgi:hypothetical protein
LCHNKNLRVCKVSFVSDEMKKNISVTTAAKEFHRDNHYVPQTYLKHWGDAGGRVWAYRVLVAHPNAHLWKHTSTKGLGHHAHLYTRVVASDLTDEVERWLESDFETPAGKVIQKVVDDARLTSQDWLHLIRFLAAQDVRTPARLMEMLQRWNQTLPQLIDDTLKDSVKKLEASKRDGKPLDRGSPIDAGYFPLRVTTELVPGEEQGILRAETIVGRGLFLFNLKHLLTKTVNALLAHKWTILRAPKGIEWLTSDDPVVRLNYHNSTKYDFGGGWGSNGTEIFLPLSPHHLLYTRIGTMPPQRGTVISAELASQLQRFTIEHAHRFIFSATPEKSVSELRPRIVDPAASVAEVEQWKRWHEEQTTAERDLFGPRRAQ